MECQFRTSVGRRTSIPSDSLVHRLPTSPLPSQHCSFVSLSTWVSIVRGCSAAASSAVFVRRRPCPSVSLGVSVVGRRSTVAAASVVSVIGRSCVERGALRGRRRLALRRSALCLRLRRQLAFRRRLAPGGGYVQHPLGRRDTVASSPWLSSAACSPAVRASVVWRRLGRSLALGDGGAKRGLHVLGRRGRVALGRRSIVAWVSTVAWVSIVAWVSP